jgi:hypothetical protein
MMTAGKPSLANQVTENELFRPSGRESLQLIASKVHLIDIDKSTGSLRLCVHEVLIGSVRLHYT